MKKLTYIFLTLFFLQTSHTEAQVTLEHTYSYYHTYFWVTDIGNNEYKYVVEDSTGFSIYNLDHTLYMPHIIPPVPIFQPPSYYEIAYLTKSLFDCDSTNIEYVITTPHYSGNFYIYRTDGTLIFERDTVNGHYCTGCQNGSIYTEPVFNTPNGTKLLLFTRSIIRGGDPDSMYVYSLCGKLPLEMHTLTNNENFVNIFPNPSNGIINFEISFPNNTEDFKLTIYNSSFQVVEKNDVNRKNYQFDSNKRSLASGTYLFDLSTENKVYQTGKFILTK